ncbi:poly (ADP-ribose) polymerase, putative, partial [Bodo saltans]
MEPLLQRATQFVNDQQYFQRGVGRAHFIPNPCMIASCSAFQRFAKGASLTQLLDISAQCQIAFHGTAKEAVGAICCRGFDVARRHGQAHGPGEYFGATADISASYARGSEQMIVCALITNKVANCQGGSILVVNNPTNDPSQTFVIPLGVVLFGATTLNHQLAPGGRLGEDVFSCTYPKQDASLAQGKQLVDTARRRCSEPISPE